jgi:hypothetical protein
MDFIETPHSSNGIHFTYHKFHQIMQQLMALGIFEMF